MKHKIKINNLIYILLLFPFIEPLLFKEEMFYAIDNIYKVYKIISFLIIFVLFIKKVIKEGFKIKNNSIVYLIVLLETLLLITTIINKGSISSYIGPAISVVSLSLLTYIFFGKLKDDFIKINYMYLGILMILNLLSIILFPNGINRTIGGSAIYFLGIDNRFIFFYIPLIYFAMSYSFIKYKKLNISSIIIILICLFTTMYFWSVGAFMGLLIIAISFVLCERFKCVRKIKLSTLAIFIIVLNILIVHFHIQDYFSDFIINVLKKDITFSGRTRVWDSALYLFKTSPIIGIGVHPTSFFAQYYNGVGHAHNVFLNYLVNCGAIGLGIYFSILFSLSKSVKQISDEQIRVLSSIVAFTILFLSIGDTLDSGIFYLVFCAMYYYKEIYNEKENRNSNIS